jgi:hypothetical protein
MTPEEYRQAVNALGLNLTTAAEFFDVSPRTGMNWALKGPPRSAAMLLRVMLAKRLSPANVVAIAPQAVRLLVAKGMSK